MKKWIDKHLKGIFVTPSIIFILLMIVVPLAYNFFISFTDWQMSIVKAPKFIGLSNYIEVLQDERFRASVWRTIVFSGIAITLEAVLGVALAVLINRKFHGRRLVQALMLLPVVATPVALGMVWNLMLEPSIGIGNVIMVALGFERHAFLSTTTFESMFWLIMIDVWEWTPMVMLMVYGGLMTIPHDPYESALIDGANKWQDLYQDHAAAGQSHDPDRGADASDRRCKDLRYYICHHRRRAKLRHRDDQYLRISEYVLLLPIR